MAKISRRTKIIILFVVVVAAGYAVVHYSDGSTQVPQDFTDARLQGAIIAQNIVSLSDQSTDDLQQIDTLDKQGNYAQALTLTTNLVTQSAQIRNQAVALSSQIEAMTKSLSEISDITARQDALDSISSRLALINQLITYSNDLDQLLTTLQNKFSGQGGNGNATQVTALVNQINTDVNAINNFNAQADTAMTQFDSIESK